jgi:hypothetical protein
MALTKRQLMKIACTIADTSIEAVAREWKMSDMMIHLSLDGKTFNGKKSRGLNKKIDDFINMQFQKHNMTNGNFESIAV